MRWAMIAQPVWRAVAIKQSGLLLTVGKPGNTS